MSTPDDHRLTLVEHAVAAIARTNEKTQESLSKMADAMVTLARLDERQSENRDALERVATEQAKHAERLRTVEIALPPLVEMRGYVVKALVALCGMVGAALVGLVLIK